MAGTVAPPPRPRRGRRWPAALRRAAVVVASLAGLGPAQASPAPAEWRFTVRLDGKPIGTHSFVLARAGERHTTLESEARLDVTVLGLPLYRYRHRASERWIDGCLAAIDARTDDNGRTTEVRGHSQGGRFDLQAGGDGRAAPTPAAEGCLMSFAYWNPALAAQTRLLDPGTGRIEAVAMIAPAEVPTDLRALAVRGLRIGGLAQPIDVWYAGDRWIALDTVVDGGRRLSYRLR